MHSDECTCPECLEAWEMADQVFTIEPKVIRTLTCMDRDKAALLEEIAETLCILVDSPASLGVPYERKLLMLAGRYKAMKGTE